MLDRLAQQHAEVRVLHLTRNFGHQAAIHAGLCTRGGDAVVMMDSDLQDPPEAIGKMLEAWQAGYDVAYAIRSASQGMVRKAIAFRRLPSFAWLRFRKTPIPVDAGNFGLIDARVVRTLVALGERDRYLPGLRSWVGFKQIGIPVERGARYDDRPRISCRGLFAWRRRRCFRFRRCH